MSRSAASQVSTSKTLESTHTGDAVVYRLARELSDLPEDLRLRNVEWGVLLAVTGEHTAAQIGRVFGLTGDERRAVFGRLAEHGLVEERALSYGEYLRARATTGKDETHNLASFLRAGVAMPGAAAPSSCGSVEPQRAPSDTLGLTQPVRTQTPLQSKQTAPAPSPPAVAFTPLQTPRPEASKRLSLKVLIRHILNRSPDLNSGQLDVYRVFIRVETKLLKRNGIDTLRFEDDRRVDDPELLQAIARSLERTLGMPMPSDVYV